jgi:hypothetical protein
MAVMFGVLPSFGLWADGKVWQAFDLSPYRRDSGLRFRLGDHVFASSGLRTAVVLGSLPEFHEHVKCTQGSPIGDCIRSFWAFSG